MTERNPVVRQAERRSDPYALMLDPDEDRRVRRGEDRRQPAEGVTREHIEFLRARHSRERSILTHDICTANEFDALCDLALRGLQGPTPGEVRLAMEYQNERNGVPNEATRELSHRAIFARAILRWEGRK